MLSPNGIPNLLKYNIYDHDQPLYLMSIEELAFMEMLILQ
jgi:hypothetical protein